MLEEPPEEPVGEVLGLVALGVEPHRHVPAGTGAEDGEEVRLGLRHAVLARQRAQVRRERAGLDADTGAGDPPDVVRLEQVVVGPQRGGVGQRVDHRP